MQRVLPALVRGYVPLVEAEVTAVHVERAWDKHEPADGLPDYFGVVD